MGEAREDRTEGGGCTVGHGQGVRGGDRGGGNMHVGQAKMV